MKILFITENIPYPLDSGGRIRSFHMLRALASKHDVTLLTSSNTPATIACLALFRSFCADVRVAHIKSPGITYQTFLLANAVRFRRPFLLFRHYHTTLAKLICHVVQGRHFHAVHYDHLDSTIYSRFIPHAMHSLLDEHNIVSNQFLTTAKTHPSQLLRILLRAASLNLQRYESMQCSKMTHCFVCSDFDRHFLLHMSPDAQVSIIPNGVDISHFSPISFAAGIGEKKIPNSLIFIGSLDYAPCSIAVEYFLKDILPPLRRLVPTVSFCIVGANPSARLRRLAESIPGVTLTGRVPDTRPYLAQSHLSVVPLKSGSGTRLKILEAMAMGLPVVSTTIGAEGLNFRHEHDLLLADTPQDFAVAIARLLENPLLAEQIRKNALCLVKNKYTWEIAQQLLLSTYESLDSLNISNTYNDFPNIP
jgi:polysaccharide biosynthesis protein PslH